MLVIFGYACNDLSSLLWLIMGYVPTETFRQCAEKTDLVINNISGMKIRFLSPTKKVKFQTLKVGQNGKVKNTAGSVSLSMFMVGVSFTGPSRTKN
jgi:hypothetical protein